jgi:peptidoglycan hydrolase-like protein with peptidoglycan-binding domain
MNKKIFKQWDSRWGKLPYTRKPKTIASSGCGCCSVTHCLIEEPEYDNWTPRNVRPYMVSKGYAIYGKGTSWDGITKTLEHYGYTVKRPNISSSMRSAWNILPKSMKRGVLLFRGGSKGGVTWTLNGHYVAFTRYKVKDGKHWFYTKDSGRWNDGWHCYETKMAGLVPQIWICTDFDGKYPRLKNKKGYKGVIPSPTLKRGTTEKTKTKQWQEFLNWTFGEKVIKNPKGNFKKKTELYTKYFQKNCGLVADGVVGKKTVAKARAMKG